MDNINTLSRTTRFGMIGAGVLQGALCYFLLRMSEAQGLENQSLIFLYGMMGTLALSGTLLFAVENFRQRALWVGVALVMIVVCAMGAWLRWNLQSETVWQRGDTLAMYGFLLVIMALLFLPWFQARLQTRRFNAGYALFCQHFWQNGLTVLLLAIALGLFWLVLYLWSSLFEMLSLKIFHQLFFETRWFFCLSTGLICALVVIRARGQARLMLAVQNLLRMLAVGLLPLTALVVLLFTVTLPFVGLKTLSGQVSAAGLLNTLTFMLLVLTAMVWTPDKPVLPLPAPLRWLVRTSLVLLPVLTLLAAWAVWARVAQYGWTQERLFAAVTTAVAIAWSIGYAISASPRQRQPLAVQGIVNQSVTLLMLVLLILLHSPVLDRYRISVNSQMARYHSGQTAAKDLTIYELQEGGRRGFDALRSLRKDMTFISDPERRRWLDMALDNNRPTTLQPLTEHVLRRNITLATRFGEPDNALWAFLIRQNDLVQTCGREAKNCLLMAQDLNSDGVAEWLLFDFDRGSLTVLKRGDKGWDRAGYGMSLPEKMDQARVLEAFKQGKAGTVPKKWQDVSINGERIDLDYYAN